MTSTSPTALVISAARVWVRERRQRTRLAEALAVVVALAAMVTLAPTAAQAASVPATARDLIVTGGGDDRGYHLFQATAVGGWQWRPLATILPQRMADVDWTGRQCVTGDGRYVVVVVAPRQGLTHAAVADSGAMSYVVDMAAGAVRPLVAGVGIRYFSPGCGVDDRAVLTRF